MFMCGVFTNAIDLAHQINRLNYRGIRYQIDICEGIDNEQVVLVTWREEVIEEES